MKCRLHKPAVLALLGVLLVATGAGFSTAARAGDLAPDTPCKWSRTVNGLKGRICLSRTAVVGGSTVVLGTLTLRNETRRAITVSRWFESMRYSIVDGNGAPVTAGINEGGSAGGSLSGYSSNPQVVPPRGELSIPIPGGGGVMRNKAAVLMLGTWDTLYTVEPTEHPPYLHAVLEIDEREVGRPPPEPRDWFGRLEFRDVQIPLGVEKAHSSKVTSTMVEARKMLATNDRDQLRDALYKLTLLDSLRVVPLYMQAFEMADSLGADYVQGVVVDSLGWLLKHHPGDDLKEVIAGLQKASQPGAAIPQVRAQAEEYLQVSVAGRVLDANGNPMANARVGIFRGVNPDNAPCQRSVQPEECLDFLVSMGADRAHAVTGEDGRYTLRVPGGLVLYSDTLWVEAANARGERLRFFRTIDACCGLRAQLDNIVLQRVADFTAQIQHEGKPVAAAQVSFLPGFLYGDPQQTDATGSVTTHRNPEPTVDNVAMMVVRAEGFATEYRGSAIRPGTTTQTIDLARETVLTGRIIGPGGKSLAQATLRAIFVPGTCPPCFPLYLDPIAGTTRTDDAGMFALHGLRAGQSYRLLIDADGASIASSERLVTAGSGPIEIALNTAVPVTLAISGLRGVPPLRGAQSAESIAANASFNKMVIERALSAQPELVDVTRACFGCGPGLTILMEWLDPDTGAWLPVLTPRKVTVRDATHADLRFDKVPIGTIRVSTTGVLAIAVQTFDLVTIRPGRPIVIPVQVTALRQLQVQVIGRDGKPASGVRVEVGSADGQFTSYGNEAADGTLTFETDPTRDMSIRVIEADKVISTTPVPRGAARSNPLVMKIRL